MKWWTGQRSLKLEKAFSEPRGPVSNIHWHTGSGSQLTIMPNGNQTLPFGERVVLADWGSRVAASNSSVDNERHVRVDVADADFRFEDLQR